MVPKERHALDQAYVCDKRRLLGIMIVRIPSVAQGERVIDAMAQCPNICFHLVFSKRLGVGYVEVWQSAVDVGADFLPSFGGAEYADHGNMWKIVALSR